MLGIAGCCRLGIASWLARRAICDDGGCAIAGSYCGLSQARSAMAAPAVAGLVLHCFVAAADLLLLLLRAWFCCYCGLGFGVRAAAYARRATRDDRGGRVRDGRVTLIHSLTMFIH